MGANKFVFMCACAASEFVFVFNGTCSCGTDGVLQSLEPEGGLQAHVSWKVVYGELNTLIVLYSYSTNW